MVNPEPIGNFSQAVSKYVNNMEPVEKENLPTLLLWGNDSDRLREERERLESIYKCVCVVGEKAKEKYLEKHAPDRVMQIR